MATPAHLVLLVWRRRVLARVGNQPAHVITFSKDIDNVGFTRAMAGFAALCCEGRAQIHLLAVLVVIDLYDVCGMALATGLAIEVACTSRSGCLRLGSGPGFRLQAAAAQTHKHDYQGSDDDLHMPVDFLWPEGMKPEIFQTYSAVFFDLDQDKRCYRA